MSAEWAAVVVSLVSVVVGAALSIGVSLLNTKLSKGIELASEQRHVMLTLSKYIGESLTSLDLLSQIIKLNQQDVLKDHFDVLQGNIKKLSSYSYENKILLPDDLRVRLDKLSDSYVNVSVHTYIATYRKGDYLALTDNPDLRTKYIAEITKSLEVIRRHTDAVEKSMRKLIGVGKK